MSYKNYDKNEYGLDLDLLTMLASMIAGGGGPAASNR